MTLGGFVQVGCFKIRVSDIAAIAHYPPAAITADGEKVEIHIRGLDFVVVTRPGRKGWDAAVALWKNIPAIIPDTREPGNAHPGPGFPAVGRHAVAEGADAAEFPALATVAAESATPARTCDDCGKPVSLDAGFAEYDFLDGGPRVLCLECDRRRDAGYVARESVE